MASDSFTNTDGTPLETHDVKWINLSVAYPVTGLEIISNECIREGTYGNHGALHNNGQPDNQSSEVVFPPHGHNGVKHVCVRAGVANSKGYSIAFSNSSGGNWLAVSLYKDGAYFAGIAAGSWPQASSYLFKIEATGTSTTTINSWLDGTPLTTRTDSTTPILTGLPGFWGMGVAVISYMRFDNWTDGISAGAFILNLIGSGGLVGAGSNIIGPGGLVN